MIDLLKQLLANLVTNPGVLITIGLTVLGLILGTKGMRRRRVLWAGQVGYMGVESLKAQLREEGKDTAALDKAGEALRLATEYMVNNNWGELTPADQELLKIQFQSMHGANKLTEKLLTVGKVATPFPH